MNKIIKNFTQGQPLIEGLVIVVSILLAFAIEAWWAEELDRQVEQEELSRLHMEFTGNLNGIRRNAELQKIVRDGTVDLYQTIQNSQGAETVALSNGLLRVSLFTPTYDVATPALDALVLSGLLNVVQDNGVLAAIAAWQRAVKNVTESEVSAREFTELQLFPSFVERGNMGPLLIVDSEQSDTNNNANSGNRDAQENRGAQRNERGDGQRGGGVLLSMQFNDEQETLIKVDSALEGLIAQRTRGADRSAQSLSRLEDAANRLISAIENAQGL
jgi:hypothetical protein